MLNSPLPDCLQARESISARLDEELPELELERLRQHLLVCAPCTVWAEQVEAATLQLRNAALEAPGAPVVGARRSRRRIARPLAVGAAAAASLVAAFGAHTLLGSRQTAAPTLWPQRAGLSGNQAYAAAQLLKLNSVPEDLEARVTGLGNTSLHAV